MATGATLRSSLSLPIDAPGPPARHGHLPPRLVLNYSLHRDPSKHGGALISPARSSAYADILSRELTPRTPSFVQGADPPSAAASSSTTSSSRAPSVQLRSPTARHPTHAVRGSSIRMAQQTSGSAGAGPSAASPTSPRRYSLPTPPEQEHFEQLCRSRFYEQDSDAALQIDHILREASGVSAQNCYNRILAAVRSEYHEHVAEERRRRVEQLFDETRPNVFMGRVERREQVKKFLENHVSREMIGTHPFAKALWTLLNLQATKIAKGGAGPRCMEWCVQEEVFTEAGGAEWLHDSVNLLKSTLGMLEVVSDTDEDAELGARSQDVPAGSITDTTGAIAASRTVQAGDRPRTSNEAVERSKHMAGDTRYANAEVLRQGKLRVFRMDSQMTNPELRDLASLFPSWIATSGVRNLRFSAVPDLRIALQPSLDDMEEGMLSETDKIDSQQALKVPTGHLRLSSVNRDAGHEGTLVDRVRVWFKRLLGYPC